MLKFVQEIYDEKTSGQQKIWVLAVSVVICMITTVITFTTELTPSGSIHHFGFPTTFLTYYEMKLSINSTPFFLRFAYDPLQLAINLAVICVPIMAMFKFYLYRTSTTANQNMHNTQ
ncbi:MAG: hypothetical protein FWE34_07810 [Defluviitaleaceae bacterium]|nr:hypothetical protein [Defluviitaleaceae bacterium]